MALLCGLCKLGRRLAPGRIGAERFGDGNARAQAVLMKTISGPGAAKPGVTASLDVGELLLRRKRRAVILWVLAHEFAECLVFRRRKRRIEADEERLAGVDALQIVHPVGDGDVVCQLTLTLPAQEIP